MENIKTIKATIKDIDLLQKIGKLTFIETYASENSEENMSAYLENRFSTENLKAALTCKDSEFYFAKQQDQVIGYLKINLAQPKTKITIGNALEIERIYVVNEFQGKKVGQLLLKKAIEVSKQKKVNCIWLGVWEQNLKAMRFYKKNRFEEFDKHIFKLGDDHQTDIFMKIEMN